MAFDLVKRGITEVYQKFSWDNYDELFISIDPILRKKYTKVKYVCIRWESALLDNSLEQNLLLRGTKGCGKTVLGCILIKDLLLRNIKAFRISFSRLQQLYYEEWKVPEIALVPDVLFLDDIGKESVSKTSGNHEMFMMENILSYRYERGYRTIVAMEFDSLSFERRYGQGSTDILRNNYYAVNFPDYNLGNKIAQIKRENLKRG